MVLFCYFPILVSLPNRTHSRYNNYNNGISFHANHLYQDTEFCFLFIVSLDAGSNRKYKFESTKCKKENIYIEVRSRIDFPSKTIVIWSVYMGWLE